MLTITRRQKSCLIQQYKKIPEDPTSRQRSKLISILKNIKVEGGLSEEVYRRIYPTGAVSPKFYGLPKIHNPGIPLRPIVSSTGTVTYSTAKELAKILKALGGMSTHHGHNTRDFVEHLKDVRLNRENVSYLMMLQHSLHQCHFNLWWTSFNRS